MKELKRLHQYTKERFSLFQFVPLTFILAGSASFVLVGFGGVVALQEFMLASVALLLFFFRLRLFDEKKDEEHDRVHYPHRPLVRGFISRRWVGVCTIIVLLIELSIALSVGQLAMVLFFGALAYSFLMYVEFFMKKFLEKHFMTYVLSHEALAVPLFLYLYAILGFPKTGLDEGLLWLLAMQVCCLFFLEVARKLRRNEGSNLARDTYAEHLGVRGSGFLATLLLLTSSLSGIMIVVQLQSLAPLYLPLLASTTLLGCFGLVRFMQSGTITHARSAFSLGIISALLPQAYLASLFVLKLL